MARKAVHREQFLVAKYTHVTVVTTGPIVKSVKIELNMQSVLG